jgi:hypothetical protein
MITGRHGVDFAYASKKCLIEASHTGRKGAVLLLSLKLTEGWRGGRGGYLRASFMFGFLMTTN